MSAALSASDALRFLAAFLFGAIPFAAVAMLGTGVDIRKVGSGNPGFNNVLRVSTKPRAFFTLFGDISKGYVALWLLTRPTDPPALVWALGLMPVIGHCWTPFLKFHGGKGVATTVGVLLFLEPKLTLLCLPLFLIVRLVSSKMGWAQKGAIASLALILAIAVTVAIVDGAPAGVFGVVFLLLIVVRHQSNIREMLKPSTTSAS